MMHKSMRFIYPMMVGMLLGVMQTGLFLQLSFTLSSSFGTYLMVTLAWLIGSAIGASLLSHQSPKIFLMLSLVSYGAINLLLLLIPFRTGWWIIYALAIIAIGIYPGIFFGRMADYYPARVLFFRENNGFILGIVVSTILFMLYGRNIVWGVPIILTLILFAIPEKSLQPDV